MHYTLLSCIDSRIIEPTKFYGRFKLGPFASSQALTIANSLRRTLLSQLPGTAITLIQIDNASHEYDTLTGVRECVLDIILNIKQIVLKSEFEVFTPQTGFLNIIGPGIIRARDLKLPFFIFAVDPDQYIATITDKGQLNMKFLINCGKNYLIHTPSSSNYDDLVNLLNKAKPKDNINKFQNYQNIYKQWKNLKIQFLNQSLVNSEIKQLPFFTNRFYNQYQKLLPFFKPIISDLQKPDLTIKKNTSFYQNTKQTDLNSFAINKQSYFPIDSLFSPITRVNYSIESNDLNREIQEFIIFEIWTNGTIDPRHAIHNAAKSLIELFLPLQQLQIRSQKLNNFIDVTNTKKQYLNQSVSPISTNLLHINNILNDQIITQNKKTITVNKVLKSKLALNQKFKFTTNFKPLKTLKNELDQKNKLINKNSIKFDAVTKFKLLKIDLINLNVTTKVYHILKMNQINTINDLIEKSPKQLLAFTDFGLAELLNVQQNLKKYALNLKEDS